MHNPTFYVTACWDEEAGVFYSESDIEGLHVEAASVAEFRDIVLDVAMDLIAANHMSNRDFAKPLQDMIPVLVLKGPEEVCEPARAYA